ncbi:MAG: sensor histidine kinase, partial [Planctomycetota bacterium]
MQSVINFEEATAWLRGTSATSSWSDRRDLARSVVESLALGQANGGALALLCELADDAKWEVRREVAEGLLYLSDSDFFHVAGKLAGDTNSFVRQAAERAMDRRRQIAKEAGAARRTVDEINRQVELLEKSAGPDAAARAWKICDRYGELVVGSMVHDLRSILTYLKSHCQALIDEANKRRKAAVRVRSDLDFLQRTINDMESFTQPVPSQRHRERLADIVRAAMDLAHANAVECGNDVSHIEVRVDVPDSITVEVARHGLVMALANVIKNALEACAGNATELAGEVCIAATPSDECV